MYCTGGVRCERASVLVKKQLGDAVKGVYQLQVLVSQKVLVKSFCKS